jgi:hypothetical protein
MTNDAFLWHILLGAGTAIGTLCSVYFRRRNAPNYGTIENALGSKGVFIPEKSLAWHDAGYLARFKCSNISTSTAAHFDSIGGRRSSGTTDLALATNVPLESLGMGLAVFR